MIVNSIKCYIRPYSMDFDEIIGIKEIFLNTKETEWGKVIKYCIKLSQFLNLGNFTF